VSTPGVVHCCDPKEFKKSKLIKKFMQNYEERMNEEFKLE